MSKACSPNELGCWIGGAVVEIVKYAKGFWRTKLLVKSNKTRALAYS